LSQLTFVADPWLVADTNGKCKAIYVGAAHKQVAKVID
jgi:hypothetical protein